MEKQGEVADSGCQRQRSSSTIKYPNFCKLIVSPPQDTLRIPGKFVKKLGNELFNIATLTTPNGCIFYVKLEKIDGKLCFTGGWHEFVEHHSIGVDYLLIFAYIGNSNLRVNIYDLSNAEVNYQCNPLGGRNHVRLVPVKEEVEDDASVEILYSFSPRQTLKSWENKEANSAHGKKAKVNIAGISNSAPSLSREAKGDGHQSDLMTSGSRLNQRTRKRKKDEHQDSAQKASKLSTSGAETSSRRLRAINPQEKLKVLNASKAFQSVNPFCKVLLRPSYVYKGNNLYMPSSFAEKYLRGVSEFLTLKVPCGEEWPIGCTWLNGSAKLSKGWHQFVLANKLEEGDICVFELVRKVDIVLKLTIFRVAKAAEPEKKKIKKKMQNREPAYKVITRSKSAN